MYDLYTYIYKLHTYIYMQAFTKDNTQSQSESLLGTASTDALATSPFSPGSLCSGTDTDQDNPSVGSIVTQQQLADSSLHARGAYADGGGGREDAGEDTGEEYASRYGESAFPVFSGLWVCSVGLRVRRVRMHGAYGCMVCMIR